jgi:hypothetical protein
MSKQKIKSETLSRKTEAATITTTTTMNKELEKKPNNISILENEIAELERVIQLDQINLAELEQILGKKMVQLQKCLQLQLTGGGVSATKAETKI